MLMMRVAGLLVSLHTRCICSQSIAKPTIEATNARRGNSRLASAATTQAVIAAIHIAKRNSRVCCTDGFMDTIAWSGVVIQMV